MSHYHCYYYCDCFQLSIHGYYYLTFSSIVDWFEFKFIGSEQLCVRSILWYGHKFSLECEMLKRFVIICFYLFFPLDKARLSLCDFTNIYSVAFSVLHGIFGFEFRDFHWISLADILSSVNVPIGWHTTFKVEKHRPKWCSMSQ